ncbi:MULTISPECIES: fasciclin domain-containing protein [unclassified Yoonia]|uniref:fasciclin domain-containing protein n=1 Tax=unclassified Yoonia TaxID=2629118 RepID=UPI002AFFF12E|nr:MULTISPECIES: fasciclin domain-containing protein [unclassified Yoonia]
MNRRFALKSAICAVATASFAACVPVATEGNVIDVMAANSDFTTLIAAATAADIVTPMSTLGPFTVFAPSNAAFDALPAGTLENLLLPENKDQLYAIMVYHVVPGTVTTEQMAGQRLTLATINNAGLPVDGRDGLKVGGATVTAGDTPASNGVIHTIDRLLMP